MRRAFDFDVAVIGAGAVGLSVAYSLAIRGRAVVIIEKELAIGQGVSSRNSEVIHGGLYYPTGSLKARLAVEGRRRLYDFIGGHGVAHRRCGKLVVATEEAETSSIQAIACQGERNGVEGLSWLSGREARLLEPELRCVGALLSAESGIIDSHGYMLALLGEIESNGGVLARRTLFVGSTPMSGGGFVVQTGDESPVPISAAKLVNCAGLGAQACAAGIEGYPAEAIPRLHYGKGVYFRLRGRPPFERLVYPPPVQGALGTHYTVDLAGQGRFGPDLAFVQGEEYDVDERRSDQFYTDIRRYWPNLPDSSLEPDYAAIRPKIHGPGEAQPDFRIDGPERHGLSGLVSLFGIESPGLTCSLSIGEMVADMLFYE